MKTHVKCFNRSQGLRGPNLVEYLDALLCALWKERKKLLGASAGSQHEREYCQGPFTAPTRLRLRRGSPTFLYAEPLHPSRRVSRYSCTRATHSGPNPGGRQADPSHFATTRLMASNSCWHAPPPYRLSMSRHHPSHCTTGSHCRPTLDGRHATYCSKR